LIPASWRTFSSRCTTIQIDPGPADLSGPEIAYLHVFDAMGQTDSLEVWRPGEGVFASRYSTE
jgi:hypothetical protein